MAKYIWLMLCASLYGDASTLVETGSSHFPRSVAGVPSVRQVTDRDEVEEEMKHPQSKYEQAHSAFDRGEYEHAARLLLEAAIAKYDEQAMEDLFIPDSVSSFIKEHNEGKLPATHSLPLRKKASDLLKAHQDEIVELFAKYYKELLSSE